MDHKTAESLFSVDKYLLHEMSPDERTQFEEHLFDCPICSDQVRRNFTALENLKEVLREEKVTVTSAKLAPAGWRDWFRPASLIPTFAALALACIVGYQNLAGPASTDFARILPPPAAVLLPVSRGGEIPAVQLDRHSTLFQLEVKGDSSHTDSFDCEFQNAAGTKLLTLRSAPQKSTDFDLQFQLPAKDFPVGRYQLTLRPASEPDRIIAYPFAVVTSAVVTSK